MLEGIPALPREPPWKEFARAPLVPAAAASAIGLVLDRIVALPLEASFTIAAISIVAWAISRRTLFVALAFVGLAAAHHHLHRHGYAADDLGEFASTAPAIVKVRGFLEEVPTVRSADRSELFGPARRVDRASTVISVREIASRDSWQPASGRARLIVERVVASVEPGILDALRIGDEIEVVGLLAKPSTPGNPGEKDYSSFLQDRRIRAELRITKGADAVTRLQAGPWSWNGLLASLRARFTQVLHDTLPASDTPLARALLLGDAAATDQDDWDAFARTGVLHVLAISGQHLVILAGAVWLLFRLIGLPRRQGAFAVIALIVIYAALTGGRPSAVRAAVMVSIVCGAFIARRTVNAANAFALAWLIVVALNPADAISPGSLLSFLSVFVLIWGAVRWLEPAPPTPVEQLLNEARPAGLKFARMLLRWIFVAYAVNLILTLANTPLVIATQNVAPPIGLVIGPPVVLLTTVALLSGFLQLLIGAASPLLALPFAAVTGLSLSWSKSLVMLADRVPGGAIYLPDLPLWWVIGFYALLILLVLLDSRKTVALTLAVWTLLGLLAAAHTPPDELRITFLSVGHGGCTVLETPDGRVLLYDAGTMAGPDTVKRIIAPFLWHRGIRRIDELFLSHADLDHYNGVPELLRRFPVGQVTLTPSFAGKSAAEVAEVLLALDRYNVPRRIAIAGDAFTAGDVTIDVLHPPRVGPAGSENERSLVLKVTHHGHTILLTGDLEKSGTTLVLALPAEKIDVLVAPHHGSPTALPESLFRWASPKLIIASRGPPTSTATYEAWDTWTHGAVTVHSHTSGLSAETFRTRQRQVLTR